MLFIKIKVKGFLKNLTEKTEQIIETNAIKKDNKINYVIDNTKYKLIIEKNKIVLHRENNELSHTMTFINNKTTTSEYYLKELNYSLEFNILTTQLKINNLKIEIKYKIIESDNQYNFVIEMSGSNEY